MKKIICADDYSTDQRSWTGKKIRNTLISIAIYDKNCGSASCLEITMREEGDGQDRVINHSIPKEKLLELKQALNSMEF